MQSCRQGGYCDGVEMSHEAAVGKIAQEIHGLGGYINGFTSYDCTCYWIVLPSAYFTTALEIQADAVRMETLLSG